MAACRGSISAVVHGVRAGLRRPRAAIAQQFRGLATSSSSSSSSPSFRDVVLSRYSCGRFDSSRPVAEEAVREILALTLRSPSSFNMSPFRVVVVDDASAKEDLALAMLGLGNQSRVREAPLTAVFLADLQATRAVNDVIEMERRAGNKSAAYLRGLQASMATFASNSVVPGASAVRSAMLGAASHLVPTPTSNSSEGWAFKNASLAAMTYMLAATSKGLATHPMEGFDAERVKRAIGVGGSGSGGVGGVGGGEGGAGAGPCRWAVPMVIPTGYAAPPREGGGQGNGAARSARLSPEKVFWRNAVGRAYEGVSGDL